MQVWQKSDTGRETERIKSIRCYPYAIPFRQGFATAHGLLTLRQGIILEISTEDNLHGIGEIAPLPEFSGESLEIALKALPELVRQFQGETLATVLALLHENPSSLPATVQSGLELAVFDILGKSTGQSIAELLQSDNRQIKTDIQVNAVIGARSLKEAIVQAHKAIEKGFSCIKLKMVGNEREQLERVAHIRETIGPSTQLRLDANEGWTFEQACSILKECERYHIQYVEQPLVAADRAGMRALQRETSIPLAADEAVESLESARNILTAQAAKILILKPQLIGGLRNTQTIIDEATSQGIACVITSSIETGIGLAGALHLVAASPAIELACGLATLELLENDLLIEKLSIQQGRLAVPMQPGLGVSLDRTALALYSTNARMQSEND